MTTCVMCAYRLGEPIRVPYYTCPDCASTTLWKEYLRGCMLGIRDECMEESRKAAITRPTDPA